MVDLRTGRLLWNFHSNQTVLTRPVVADGIVMFGCYDGFFYAHDLKTGQIKWRVETGEKHWFCEPSVTRTTVLFGCNDGNLYALDIQTGDLRWKFLTQGRMLSDPQVKDDVVVLWEH